MAESSDDVIERMWRDYDAGELKPLADYIAACPDSAEAIAREFLAMAQRGDEEDRDPSRKRIGRYEILDVIDSGGQGIVYLARDTQLGREVALKILHRRLADLGGSLLARFIREGEVLSRLDHPGICPMYDAGTVHGSPYISMKRIRGRTLREEMRGETADFAVNPSQPTAVMGEDTPPPESPKTPTPSSRQEIDRILRLFEQIAGALHAAHEAGVIHRDIKPGNIMITEDHPVVLDFGLAGLEDPEDWSSGHKVTEIGELFGTPDYMSPEQLTMNAIAVDRRSDVYSLGVCLYECLTGQRPSVATTREALYEAILGQPPTPVRTLNPSVATDLATVVSTALEKERNRRYPTARAFAEDLRRARENEPILARPTPLWLRARRWYQRNKTVALSAAAIIVTLVTGLSLSLSALGREKQALRLATESSSRERETLAVFAKNSGFAALVAEADTAWPRREEHLQSMRAWVDSALLLQDRVRRQDASIPQALADELSQQVASVGARIDRTRELALASKDREELWLKCEADIRRNKVYGSPAEFSLPPQVGLVPLGRDSESGLWEFWCEETGARPEWVPQSQATPSVGRVKLGPDSGLVLVLVPGGEFLMGAQFTDENAPNFDPNCDALDGRPHEVKLGAFFIGKTELTQHHWTTEMGRNASRYRAGNVHAKRTVTARHPVEQITWDNAIKITRRLGLSIPTEAQWEYAARAGSTTPWSHGAGPDEIPDFGNTADARWKDGNEKIEGEDWDDGFTIHAPVASYKANKFGLFDTLGNVSEWCRDTYMRYSIAEHQPITGLMINSRQGSRDGEARRVHRGGSFDLHPMFSRVSRRDIKPRGFQATGLGLRPCRAIRR